VTIGIVLLAVVLAIVQSAVAQWQPHVVRQINMTAGGITELPAQYQVVTESWNDIVRHPTIVYMPDKKRLLLLANRGTRPLDKRVVLVSFEFQYPLATGGNLNGVDFLIQ